jgi:hypothetical protein
MHFAAVRSDVDSEFRPQVNDLALVGPNPKTMSRFGNAGPNLATRDGNFHRRKYRKGRIALHHKHHSAEQFELHDAGSQMERARWYQTAVGQRQIILPNGIGLVRDDRKPGDDVFGVGDRGHGTLTSGGPLRPIGGPIPLHPNDRQ